MTAEAAATAVDVVGAASGLGARRRARTAVRRDCLALSGPDRLVVAARDRRARRQHAALLRRLPRRRAPGARRLRRCCAARTSRTSRLFFAAHLTVKGTPPARNTIRQRLGMLRSFFDRIIEWDWTDAPARTPIFAIDVPVADDPLPEFLDDAQAARLAAATAQRRAVRSARHRAAVPDRDAGR